MTKKIFIVAVREHNYLGQILNAYLIETEKNKDFFEKIETVKGDNEKNLNFEQKKIITLINQFSDKEILRVFSKKKNISAQDFFIKIDEKFFEERIQPYLEIRIKKILDIIIQYNIPFYYRTGATIHCDDKIEISTNKSEAIFNFIKENDYTKYFLSIKQNNLETHLLNAPFLALVKEPAYIIINNKLHYFTDIDSKKLLPFFDKKYIEVKKSAEKVYYQKFILQTLTKYHVKHKGFLIENKDFTPKLLLQFNTGLDGKYAFEIKFAYDTHIFSIADKRMQIAWLDEENNPFHFHILKRKSTEENQLIEKIQKQELKQINEKTYSLNFNDNLSAKEFNFEFINWLNNNKKNLINQGITILQNNTLDKYYTESLELDINTQKDKDWFDLYGTVKLDTFEIPFIKLKENILNGIREYELPNGKIIILPKVWFKRFSQIFEVSNEIMGWLKIKKHHAILLEDLAGVDQSFIDSIAAIYNKKVPNITPPTYFNAQLRNYQQQGFSWMANLMKENLGACLADDMGLGKTVQTLALIQHIKENNSKKIIHSESNIQLSLFEEENQKKDNFIGLIVMPTSLIYNWQTEIKQFTKNIKLLNYSGSHREERLQNQVNYDIILTSYGILRNDIEKLNKFSFDIIVLDESQYIKNPNSKLYKAIEQLNSKRKVVLTGTPIENSLSDLWSQMNFINPGLLGSFNYFKNKYLIPIEKKKDKETSEKFKKLINPFILRRTKREVAKDLPELTEQTRFCELSEAHLELYNSEKSKIRNYLLSGDEENFKKKSKIQILQAISKLRQLANHTALVFPEKNIESEKFNEITQVINAILKEKNKVILFSSYVKILTIFKQYFENTEQNYVELTGKMSKKQRETSIKKFQTDKETNAFLISIKAGGVGLNLTAADYVIIIDPWWNPAVEAQAINRAHRIGQKNKVVVYRFISKNTIEQKIRALQNKKRNLSNDILHLDKDLQLNIKELKSLFE